MNHWSADTLPPALVVGWFSWWIWIRFLVDVVNGIWAGWFTAPLWYFNPDEPLLFGSLPDMMLWITVVGIVLAVPYLVFRQSWTWQGRAMTLLAHCVIVASVSYTVAVQRQEALSERSTMVYIRLLEAQGNERDELEELYLKSAKKVYARYTENNKIANK
jgi:hypothetical protein